MKPISVLLAVSLLANAAAVIVIARRSIAAASSKSVPAAAKANASRGASADHRDALRAALASGDAAALEAAGLSPELAREIALGRIFSRLAERARAAQPKGEADARWWQHRAMTPAARDQQLALRRELAEALTAAFGSDLGLGVTDSSQFAFLPSEKREALRRIVEDYDEMMARFSAGGIQLPSDKEKLRLLKAERDRDIAALLTPEERLAYEMRTSSTGQSLRSRYGNAIESEEDFQKLYALQKSFDEKFAPESLKGRITPDLLRQRFEAQQQLQEEFRAALGDDKYAALRRATDGDLRNVESLVSRLNLPSTTTDQVVAARDTFAAESQRINGDTSLTPPQRRAQLAELAGRAKASVAQTLGSEAGEAYAQSAPWIGMLQSGMAYSTTPQANTPGALLDARSGPGVYPVLPAGATTGGVTHQVVNRSGGDPARVSDNVMMFSAAPVDVGGAPPAGARQMIIVAPTLAPAEPAAPLPKK